MNTTMIVRRISVNAPAIADLVEPTALERLSQLPPEQVVTVATLIEGRAAAAVSAMRSTGNQWEIRSIGCRPQLIDTEVTATTLSGMRKALEPGQSLIFEPNAPLRPALQTALKSAGFQPQHTWLWFELDQQAGKVWAADQPLRGLTPSLLRNLPTTQVDYLKRVGQYVPHVDDLPDRSPVLVSPEGEPVAFAVVRQTESDVLTGHWLWVAPQHRRQKTLLVLVAECIRLTVGPRRVRWRVESNNAPLLAASAGPGQSFSRPFGTTTSFRADSAEPT